MHSINCPGRIRSVLSAKSRSQRAGSAFPQQARVGRTFSRSNRMLFVLLAVLIAAARLSGQAVVVPPPASRFVIVLDAAHGGDDTGAHLSDGQLEKSATLALSVRLRSLLSARGIQVVTTRESDQSINLTHRAEIANRAGAQACLTLHFAEAGTGVHLFASSLAPAQPTRFAAWKTAQAAWITRSLTLAGALNSALMHDGFKVTLARPPLPGVDSETCPAIVLELAPERDSDHKIKSEPDQPEYQARIATSLANALLAWRTEGRQP